MSAIGISGAGVAGMATAIAAVNAGLRAFVIAGANSGTPPGAVQLAANGWLALDRLGLGDAARAVATPLHTITVRSLESGATLARFEPGGGYAGLSRAGLAGVLGKAVAGRRDITFIEGGVAHIHQTQDSVRVVTAAGAMHEFDGFVAADGMNGPGRRHVAPVAERASDGGARARPPLPFGFPRTGDRRVAMRAEMPLEALAAHFAIEGSNLWLGRGMHVVHYPFGKMLNVVATIPAGLSGPGWHARIFAHDSPIAALGAPDLVWASTPIAAAGGASCWRRGRVVLAGDAAHTMPPHLAQGAGQSLVDAACLQDRLEASRQGGGGAVDMERALEGYARARAGEVARIVRKAEISGRVMGLSGPLARLRNATIDIGGAGLMKSWLAEVWAPGG